MSLKDFLQNNENLQIKQDLLKQNISSVLSADGVFTSGIASNATNKQKMTDDAINFVNSNQFTNTISENVGEPQEEETKEEYVSRALKVAKELLYKKFGL